MKVCLHSFSLGKFVSLMKINSFRWAAFSNIGALSVVIGMWCCFLACQFLNPLPCLLLKRLDWLWISHPASAHIRFDEWVLFSNLDLATDLSSLRLSLLFFFNCIKLLIFRIRPWPTAPSTFSKLTTWD